MNTSRSAPLSRSGATLTEVLMAILVMSIGVVSVATLFPMSLKRAVQATQLTNATILRNNAEGIIDAFPDLIHDPDGDSNYIEHFQRRSTRRYIVDPLGADAFQGTVFAPRFGNFVGASGSLEAVQSPVRWAPTSSRELFHSQDSWVTEYDGIANFTTPRRTFTLLDDEGFGLQEILNVVNDLDRFRLVFFSISKRSAEVWEFNATTLNAATTGTSITLPFSLPDSGEFGSQVIVRFERLERRYSWFLTVRKNARGYASVDLVVVFRRPFRQSDESVYTAQFIKGGQADSDPSDSIDDSVEPNEIANVNLNQYVDEFDEPAKVNRGSFIFDVGNVRWYRVQAIEETATDGVVNIFLENDIIENSSAGVIFMPRVVEVFPLGNKALEGF